MAQKESASGSDLIWTEKVRIIPAFRSIQGILPDPVHDLIDIRPNDRNTKPAEKPSAVCPKVDKR